MATSTHKARYNPRWGSEAAGVLFITGDKDPEVLLALRSEEVLEPGTWGVVGGKVEPGEDTFDAAYREAEEELGELPDGLVVGTYEYVEPDFKYTTYVVLVERWEVEPEDLNWENDDAQWERLDYLDPEDPELHFGIRHMLKNWSEVKFLED